MKIACPNCGTRFSVPDQALGTRGRTLKCARCAHRWHQMPEADGAAQPAAGPVRDGGDSHGPLADHLDTPARPSRSSPDDPLRDPLADDGGAPDPFDDDDPPMATEPAGRREASGAASGRDSAADDDGPDFDDILARLESQERERAGRPDSASRSDDLFGDDDDLPDLLREGVGRRRSRRRGPPAWASALIAVLLVVAGTAGALYVLRNTIVGWFPAAESAYTALGIPLSRPGLGLKLENVVPTREIVEDGEVLVVRGFIANVSEIPREVPALQLTLNDAQGEMVQRMTAPPPADSLAPGETTSFRMTMRNRLPEAVAIEVAFISRPPTPAVTPPGGGDAAGSGASGGAGS